MGVYSEAAARLIMPTDDNPMGLLEFSVRSQSADTAMFESMLEMDFADYFAESGQIILTEEEKSDKASGGIKAIFHKIAELFQKAWNALKQFVQRLTAKAADFFKLNKGIVDKYGNADLKAAQEKDPDKKVYRIRNVMNGTFNDTSLKDVREKVNRAYNLVKPDAGALSTEDAKSKKEELNKAIDTLTSSEHFNDQFEETTIKNLGPGSVDNFVSFLQDGYKKLLDSVVKDAEADMKLYKEARQAALKAAASAKEEADREVAAAKFSLSSAIVSVNSKYVNYGSRLVLQSLAYARKSLIAVGVAAGRKEAKKSKEEATGEAVVYDDYLELALEFATDNMIEEITFA